MDVTFDVSAIPAATTTTTTGLVSNMDETFNVNFVPPPTQRVWPNMDMTFDVSASFSREPKVGGGVSVGRDISPVVAADTTVVLDEPVFKTGINEVPAVAAADQSSESAVSSSSDRPRIVQTEPAPVFKNSSGGLRKPNYMTATTASTHRFRLPSADNVAPIYQRPKLSSSSDIPSSAHLQPGRLATKRLGRSPSPKEREGRTGAPIATHRNFLQAPSAKIRNARTPSPKSFARAATENSNPARTNQQQLAKMLVAKSRVGSETAVKRPALGRSVSTSALKHLNK